MKTKRITDIPGLMHLWQVDNLYLAGQPQDMSWDHIKELGVKKVINLRGEHEMDFSEEVKNVESRDLEYHQFPIVENGQLSAANCKKLSDMLNEDEPFFIHCGTANRVGGWLITYLSQYRGLSFDEAVDIAQENGLSNPGFIDQAEDIINS